MSHIVHNTGCKPTAGWTSI